jgi:hypothetical protein
MNLICLLFKTSNDTEVKRAENCYWDANERWKNTEAQKQAKVEIKVGTIGGFWKGTCFISRVVSFMCDS